MSRTLITGASAGLGLELARLFAADGHDLVLVARNAARLAALAEALRADFEVEVLCCPLDLTEKDAVPALLRTLTRESIQVGILVNNAGFGAYGPFTQRDWDIYQSLLDLNITALTRLTHALLPGICQAAAAGSAPVSAPEPSPEPAPEPAPAEGRAGPAGGSRQVFGIMNVASTAAFQPGPLMAAYFASKAFVLSLTEALHEELRGTGVKVSAFCPGPTRTEFFTTDPMVPAGVITPQDLAEFHRRDAKRMDAGLAVRIGYQGFLQGKAIVIPGRLNRVQAWLATRLPRGLIRRVTHRFLTR